MFDLRSLATLRIGLSAVALLDLGLRLRFFEEHYLDSGVLPRTLLLEDYWNPFWWSTYLFSGSAPFTLLTFLLHASALLWLASGYRNRAASFAAYFFQVSLVNRNPLILDAGDRLLVILFFWGCFLPWGERFRMGSPPAEGDSNSCFHWGAAAYMGQIVLMYWMAAFWKWDPAWWSRGDALALTLYLDEFTTDAGRWLRHYSWLTTFLTRGVFLIELLAPLALLFSRGRLRDAALTVLLLFHSGIGIFLDLGLFPLISMAALLGLFSSRVWGNAEDLSPVTLSQTRIEKGLTIIALSLVLLWNSWVVAKPQESHPLPLQYGLSFLRVTQAWNLFSPVPKADDNWAAVIAVTNEGEVVNLLRAVDPITLAKPEAVNQTFESQRHRMYLAALKYSLSRKFSHHYLHFLKRRWERENPEQKLQSLTLILFNEMTLEGPVDGPVKWEKWDFLESEEPKSEEQ